MAVALRRTLIFLFLLFGLGMGLPSLLFMGCITVDQNGNPVPEVPDPDEQPEPKPLRMQDLIIRATYSEKELRIPLLLSGLPQNAPLRYRIRSLPPPGNQGAQASGTAWATGYAAMSLLVRKKGLANYVCAPSFIHNPISRGSGGIEIIDAAQYLLRSGCPHYHFMPYNAMDNYSRVSTKARNNALYYRPEGFGRVDFSDPDQIRAHLLQRSVVIVTLRITSDFLRLKKLNWDRPIGRFIGRHSIAVVGYDQKSRYFILQNSAGKKWGKDGYVHISYDWFVRLCEKAFVLW